MFSGIVTDVGKVVSITKRQGTVHLSVRSDRLAPELKAGDSVAINGVCQTVTDVKGSAFSFESVAETLRRTNLAELTTGSPVNLEPALRLGDRISGHLVSGHVDCTGVVRTRRTVSRSNIDFAIQLPRDISRFVHERGSICLDGVSLTVKDVHGTMIEVTVIPYTLENTIIEHWRVGTSVNVEVDQIARYLTPDAQSRGGGEA